jgi:tetraacyldisaccharide 4'-kinase
MSEHSLYRRIIAGETGAWASPVRGVLRAAEEAYKICIALWNRRYDHSHSHSVLPIPVLSIGNITVGGTGKTPLVIDLVRRLEAMGRNPAVVSRGYKAAADEPNDEERLIRRSCPGIVYLADPDRSAAAQRACDDCGADVIVLDDGFQHRRLSRTLDIVLIDATNPFGYGHLLPRGLLREPLSSLRRAQVVVLTRCDQVSGAELSRIADRLEGLAPQATHLRCNHRVTAVETLDGKPCEGGLDGRRAVLFAAIGNPRSFATAARTLGVEVVGERWWPDHHAYRPRDIHSMLRSGRFPPHDLLLTTEKDAVKLAELHGLDHVGILVLRIAIDFVDDGGTIFQTVLEKTLSESNAR